RPLSILSAAFVLLMSALPASAQTTVAAILADIPQGTYRLTFTADAGAPDNNPRSTGDVVNFILAENGRLCTDDLSLTGATLRTAPDLALEWRNDLANSRFYFRVTDSDPDPDVGSYAFRDIQFRNTASALFGVFTLTTSSNYSATTGNCGSSTDPTSAQIETFFTSAETAYPSLFPAGSFTFTQQSGIYTYRYYDSTSIYLAVSGGQVYARGGGYGSDYKSVGSFESLRTTISNIIRPASVGGFFVGTYQTEMTDTQSYSPILDGSKISYAITTSGQLCLSTGLTLSNPVLLNNNTDVAVWRDDSTGVSYRLDLTIDDAAEGLLEVYSNSGLRFGQLSGDRTSLSATCQLLIHPDSLIMDQIERLFGLAEQLYPEYVTFGPTVSTQRTAEYTYRHYPVTNVFIAVRNGIVYSGSGMPNFADTRLGTLNEVFTMLGESTRDFVPASTLTGTYDVLVSGANPFFSFPNNTRIRLVIAANGALCIDNITLTNPIALRASPEKVSWTNIQAGIHASMTTSDTAGPITMMLTSTRGENLAALQGERVNLLAACPQPMLSTQDLEVINDLLFLAERQYPELLNTSAGINTRSTTGSVSRYYPVTGLTVSVFQNEVYIRGGDFGVTDFYIGAIGPTINQLRTEVNQQNAAAPYLVQISGNATVAIAGMAAVNRRIAISKTNSYSAAELTDEALRTLAANLLSGEIQSPDSVVIHNTVRNAGRLSFSAQLSKTTVVGSSTTRRNISANFVLQAQ
ncbi:MAG: hypothetical protein Q8J78_07235, partial [Moraxellaceae bacterium]|nr:hypothetical protein [Moraxellaceae bacterium]